MSAVAEDVHPRPAGSRIASCPSRFRRTHGGSSVFVDLDDIAAGVRAARKALETLRSPRNDRVCFGASLDQVTLCGLLVEERVEAIFPSATWIDLSHGGESRRRGR